MKPSTAISLLDRQVARHGQSLALRRVVTGGDPIIVDVRGILRGFRPEELTDGIAVGSSQIIISPTVLIGTPFELADNWLKIGDVVIANGRHRRIAGADPIKLDDVLVRLNLVVEG